MILSTILSIPFMIWVGIIVTTTITIEQLIYRCIIFPKNRKRFSIKGRVAVVSGGSEGIGLAIVEELLKQGIKKVYILSRSESKLKNAKAQLESKLFGKEQPKEALNEPTNESQENEANDQVKTSALAKSNVKSSEQEIIIIPCDVTNVEQVEAASQLIDEPIDYLFVNQGISIPGYFLEQTSQDFLSQININYVGGVNITKALMAKKSSNGLGIIFTGSTVSFYTCVGFSSYGPSKYAIRGLVESLWSEFQGHKEYHFHIAMPSDTKTPGFDRENLTKPKETVEISGVASCCTPEDTAKDIINQMREGRFYITNDFMTYLLTVTYGGLSGPKALPLSETTISVLMQYPLILISFFLSRVSRKYAKERKIRFENLTKNE